MTKKYMLSNLDHIAGVFGATRICIFGKQVLGRYSEIDFMRVTRTPTLSVLSSTFVMHCYSHEQELI